MLIGCSDGGGEPDAQSGLSERARDAGAPSTEIEPFEVRIERSVLSDLKTRLDRTRFPDQLPNTTWENGTDLATVRALADYWQNEYDWRAHEARLNRFDQFTTWIDDQRIWFIHERSERADATPLLLLHGWPGSASEFAELIEPLTSPEDPTSPAFHVIVPALPGFGFSGPTTSAGWNTDRMGRAFVTLMERLGYDDYGVQGGDWGSFVAQAIARNAPQRVRGLHLNFLPIPPPTPEALDELTEEERYRYSHFQEEEFDYFRLQEKKPQSVAYGLTDSPSGWLAWVAAVFRVATDHEGDFLTAVDRDAFLDDVSVYWVTNTIGSSMRIYREEFLAGQAAGGMPAPRLETPVAFADFPKEVIAPPRRWLEAGYNIVQYTQMPRGGHFAALEEPELLLEDVRKFFAGLPL